MRHTLWQSFQYAGRGLQDAVASQRTMRIHVLLACAVAAAVVWLDLPVAETAVLILAIAAVLAVELVNTAVEAVADLLANGRHDVRAARVKDLSAAAVLISAVGAAVAGVLVLGPPAAAAVGMGRADLLTVGRAAVLLGIVALSMLAIRRSGMR